MYFLLWRYWKSPIKCILWFYIFDVMIFLSFIFKLFDDVIINICLIYLYQLCIQQLWLIYLLPEKSYLVMQSHAYLFKIHCNVKQKTSLWKLIVQRFFFSLIKGSGMGWLPSINNIKNIRYIWESKKFIAKISQNKQGHWLYISSKINKSIEVINIPEFNLV